MLCEMCGKNQATAFVTLVANDQVKKMHLCEACAAESGLDGNHPISITDVLLGLGGEKEMSAELSNKTCPRCHMHFTDFKKTSRLGCQTCYEAFAEEIAPLLESMHKGQQHVGKTPVRVPAQLSVLKAALDAAVQAENYEEAARLRDQIRDSSGKPVRCQPKKPL